MNTKKICISILLLSVSVLGFSQISEDLSFGFQLAPGRTFATIVDDLPESSRRDLKSDGVTSTLDKLAGRNIKLMVNYKLNESVSLSSGFYFGNRRLHVRNDDGSYIGTSVYHVNYIHLPLLFRYHSNEIADYLKIIITAGPTIDFRTGEAVIGADYAHFENFAQNRHDVDPQRGRNGNNKPMNLFNSTGLSIYLGVGAEYNFTDRFSAYAGVSYHHGLTNILNSKLLFNDDEKTPITETTKWRTALLSFDFGVGFSL